MSWRGDIGRDKADKAFELSEKGISPTVIAERLGVRPQRIFGMIQLAKQRRERFTQEKEHG